MIDRRQMLHGIAASTLSLGAALPATSMAKSRPSTLPHEPEGANAPALAPMAPLPSPWTAHGSIRRAGGVLHYATMGLPSDAPPLILLHKLGGWIADWRDAAPILAEKRQVIAFDLPGHGESQWDGEPPRVHTPFETAALIVSALQEMRLGIVDIAGSSLGGCVGVVIAALYPDRVRKLALPSCVLGRASTEAEVAKKEHDQASFWNAHGLPLPVDPEFSRTMFGLNDYQRIGLEQDYSRARAGLWIKPQERGVAFTNFLELLPRILAPTLLMYGQNDQFFLKYRDAALDLLPHGQAYTIPDASGLHVQDQPQQTAHAINRFLAA